MKNEKITENSEKSGEKISALAKITAAELVAAEVLLFVMIQAGGYGRVTEFISVTVCLAAAVLLCAAKRGFYLAAAALALTVAADSFLVLLNDCYLIAMCFFSAAQLVYCAETLRQSKGKTEIILNLSLRAAAVIAAELAVRAVVRDAFGATEGVTVFYFVNFVFNVAFAFVRFKENPLLALGLLLFLLCDFSLALGWADVYVGVTSPFLQAIMNSPVDLVWIFYQPGQTLLVLSILFAERLSVRQKA